ncbi:MAG: AMP-binding protein [Candidatus Margulisbacteria bacterium]|nr:AMP-binding protein [Candidatus Margulisiibacteriota bacterium]
MAQEFKNLYEVYVQRAAEREDKPLFDKIYSYRQAWNLAKNRARFLLAQGIGRGDVVGLLSLNSWEWCVTYMAITSIGAIALHMDFNLDISSWQAMLDKVAAKMLFVSREFAGQKFERVQVADLHSGWNDQETELPNPQADMQSMASLCFTSGTTGDPKIVQLTHGNVYYTARGLVEYFWNLGAIDGFETVLAILPLYHSYGMQANFFDFLVLGGHIIFQNSLKGPDLIKSLSENTVHIFCGVPQLWEIFFDNIALKVKNASRLKYLLFMAALNSAVVWRKIPLLNKLLAKIFEPVHAVIGKNMKFFISGGAALKPKYFRYYVNMGFRIIEGYGLTETMGPALVSNPLKLNIGSVGEPTRGNEVDLRNINADGVGEVWLRGVSVMPGYWNNPKANAEVFDGDGWFNTGDLGVRDKKGELHITGRSKNIIVLDSGKNVYPEELESYYQCSPLIEEIAVFGYRVDGSEAVYAVIVPRHKTKDSYQKIKAEIERLNKNLPSYKVISNFAVSFTPLHRNSIKKLVYREIIKDLERGKYQRSADKELAKRVPYEPDDAGRKTALKALGERLNEPVFYADQTLLELEIDSLKLLDLAAFLEQRLRIIIKLEELASKQNLQEIVEYLASCSAERAGGETADLLAGPIVYKLKSGGSILLGLYTKVCGFLSRRLWGLTVVRPEYYQTENCIFAPNHESYLDIVWLWATMPAAVRRRTYMLAKKELALLAWLLGGHLPLIFVDRQGMALSSLKAGGDVLRQGASLIIFPEGTRSFDGALGEFKIGAALLAKKLRKKIVPVKIKGAFEIYPRQKHFPALRSAQKGEIALCPPLDPDDFATPEELNQKLKDVLDRA